MKKTFLMALFAIASVSAFALTQPGSKNQTFPLKGTFVSPTDQHIQYTGRISFTNPERPAFNYPGVCSFSVSPNTLPVLEEIIFCQSVYGF